LLCLCFFHLLKLQFEGKVLLCEVLSDPVVIGLLLISLLLNHFDLSIVNGVHVLLLGVCLGELVLKHSNDELDVVYLGVEGFGFAVALSKLVNELDSLHFRLIDQVLVLHLHANELVLDLGGILVSEVYLSQVLVVVLLELIAN